MTRPREKLRHRREPSVGELLVRERVGVRADSADDDGAVERVGRRL